MKFWYWIKLDEIIICCLLISCHLHILDHDGAVMWSALLAVVEVGETFYSSLTFRAYKAKSGALYFKTLRIRNIRKMDKFHSKLVCLSKHVKVTLIITKMLAYHITERITAVASFYCTGSWSLSSLAWYLRVGSDRTHIFKTKLKRLSRVKCSSLFGPLSVVMKTKCITRLIPQVKF